ncbi:hypothetical protein QAD02_014596 [Eretmocerus hayati]|uniref:Uncharacterized protein n=1 Tax=Eretmocerus hayati TaxID=131215 RepID=A0ACC2P6C0_9HYME|nr:hypothetical protein QAD02_014596 [Eretmocerus hayati]
MNVLKEKSLVTQYEGQSYDGCSKIDKHSAEEERECWASDSGSSTGSYYSNSSSSAIEWESEISPAGEVFYIESLTDSSATEGFKTNLGDTFVSSVPELTRRRSTRAGKLIRLIKRKESYRHSVRISGLASELRRNHESISRINKEREATLGSFKTGERYTVNIWVDPNNRLKLGRRATLCETYLGIVPRITSDKSKILVSGFVHNGEAEKSESIRVGDWLQKINSKEVNHQNVNRILSSIASPTEITCQFQRSSSSGNGGNLSTTVTCSNQSRFVRQLVDREESQILMNSLVKEPLGVICLKITEFSENGSDMQSVTYSFPKSKNEELQAFLFTSKGAFVTVHHMLPDVIGFSPQSTTIKTASGLAHIIYSSFGEELVLICLPEQCCNKQEAIGLSKDIICCLNFLNKDMSSCFTDEQNHGYLDHFFYLFFSWLIKDSNMWKKNGLDNIKFNQSYDRMRHCDFNFLQAAVHSLQLPRDAQIQIDAALNEMEAMDYRDWNQDPMECQRLYTILGSCLYHRRYLLTSHLPAEDLIQVHSYLRRNGIIHLMNVESVKSLVIWRRVYPTSCINRKLITEDDKSSSLTDRWFLLVVGYGHNLLAVILESGGCTAVLEDHSGPDIFYVEEAQETLRHLRKIGIPILAEKWINANAKPEIAIPQKGLNSSKASSSVAENVVGFIKPNPSKTDSYSNSFNAKTYLDSKRSSRNKFIDESRPDSSSAFVNEISRDSPSQDSLSQMSEISDQAAPVLGRRATREKANLMPEKHSDNSDSDLDNDLPGISDVTDIRQNLLSQAEYIIPKIVTTGEKNSLIYYVHIDSFEGILISSQLGQFDGGFLRNLKLGSQAIQKLLSDTKRYKKILSHDTGKSVINKSLVAIKEHGVLFEWELCTYWIVGRLYATPRPKELYICYEDCTPQNVIEMAFRLHATHH